MSSRIGLFILPAAVLCGLFAAAQEPAAQKPDPAAKPAAPVAVDSDYKIAVRKMLSGSTFGRNRKSREPFPCGRMAKFPCPF